MMGLNLKLQETECSAEQRNTVVPFQASWGLHCIVSGGHFHLLPDLIAKYASFSSLNMMKILVDILYQIMNNFLS